MSRSEFLMALYDALDGMPKQQRTEVVSEYQEYFRSEIEKGHTEEEICISLGDPITLAYAIKQRRGYGHNTQETFNERPHRCGIFKIITVVITVMVIAFTVLGGFIIINVPRGSGLSFGIGKKYKIDDTKEINLDSAKTILVQTISSNTTITPSDNGKIKGSLVGNVRTTSSDYIPTLEIRKSGDTIVIEEKRKISAIIGLYSGEVNLDINIPKSFQGNIKYEGTSGDLNTSNLEINNFSIALSSGNVRLDKIAVKNDFAITSTTGDFFANRLEANKLSFESTSGNKEFIDITIKENFDINSTSGNTTLKDISCHKLGIVNTSGTVKISNIQLEIISVGSISGNVEINDLKGGAKIESSSGNIDISVAEAKGIIYLKALSGDVKLKMPKNTGFTLDSKAISGNIDCDFNLDDKASGKNKLRGSYGSGNVPVNINTSSGNIKIKKR